MKTSSPRVVIGVVIASFYFAAVMAAQTATAPPAPSTNAPAPARRPARAGNGVVQGTVKDDTGGVIPNAVVTVTDANGQIQTATTGGDGTYTVKGLAPGNYTVTATYKGLQQSGAVLVSVAPGQPAIGDVLMVPETTKQEVTVTDTTTNQVSTDPANNAGALVLKQEDLDNLPDDPDDMQADLQALAGPSAGPGGNQIYIDGFTGGRLPPKESIREIRINSNPFSAEFDKLGFGRIQIFTKPGSDKFHGSAYYSISDDVWNTRNPFLTTNPPFKSQIFGGNLSGALSKKASFFIDVERRNIDDNGVIVATVLPSVVGLPSDNPFQPIPYQSYQPTPQRRTTVSPRIDYQLNANNTLSLRYGYLQNDLNLTGVNGFNLPSAGYVKPSTQQSIQAVETAVLGPHAVNETHFQFERSVVSENAVDNQPTLNVASSFTQFGGSGYGQSYDHENDYELQNYTSLTYGKHVTKFGFRIRASTIDDFSQFRFNGQFNFNGGMAAVLGSNGSPLSNGSGGYVTQQLTSIQLYQTTQMLLAQGLSFPTIRGWGYGPSQYTVTQGNPSLNFYQMDFGPFIQDDWRVKPNLTLSLGLRWESQTNIPDKKDFAPRFAFAWSPNAKGGTSKTVIRGGWGMFYDRFAAANVLNAYRFNGSAQTGQLFYVVQNPNSYPTPPTNLVASNSNITYLIDGNLRAPYVMQTAIGIERQLARRTTVSLNYTNSRGNHELRTRVLNVPNIGMYPSATGTTNTGEAASRTYLYESTGIFKQNQLMLSVNSAIGSKVTISARYAYGHAHSDTDGLGSIPADQYDTSLEYGRSILDIRHFLFLGGSYSAPFGIRFSPFIIIRSGAPFNITTGTDLYGIGAQTARPGLASGPGAGIISTPYGYLDSVPQEGQSILARNVGDGPGFVGINMRVSKTWGFGPRRSQGFTGSNGGGGAPRGGGFGGGGGGGRGGRGGGGGGSRGGGGGDALTEHRFNLTLSANVRNILNHANLNTPNGAMTSPPDYFLHSLGITGGFSAESTSSSQRRMDLQLRLSF